jgi:hypothetical protein
MRLVAEQRSALPLAASPYCVYLEVATLCTIGMKEDWGIQQSAKKDLDAETSYLPLCAWSGPTSAYCAYSLGVSNVVTIGTIYARQGQAD